MINVYIRQKIAEKTDRVVEMSHKLIDDTEIYEKLEPAQLHNLLNLASSTESIKAIKNFIFYQMGRKTVGEQWRHQDFGNKLLKEIIALESLVNEIIGSEMASKTEVWLEFIRLYIGYANRYFTYKRAMRGE